ncbi:hypothetical protein LMH87_009711 [Akanthomyces muscarius]|uniref:Uncharacterized protein n=1 Tax=Akanthomyces muscarius TaxID=2231603 RepID=A0A9W8QFA4_AKAMU|nr:hypothetical protein LMH87_009711 [Akanthomyces muscarius]KAJ4153214.1 hypothetical protein LMH87_009711 [Akanthomyces muscarius]
MQKARRRILGLSSARVLTPALLPLLLHPSKLHFSSSLFLSKHHHQALHFNRPFVLGPGLGSRNLNYCPVSSTKRHKPAASLSSS